MKLHYIKKMAFILLAGVATGIGAQNLNSAYFLEGYSFRHQMNPAFMGERNYVSIPVLGNINVGLHGNVGLSDFVYKYNDPFGKYNLTTALSPLVGNKEFLNKLHSRNKVNASITLSILSFGFHKWDGFNTFDLRLRSDVAMNLPYELFDFAKTGMDRAEGSHYRIKDVTVRTNDYVEMAFGHARKIDDKLTVGAKFKLLFGAGNANGKIDRMDIYMSQDSWTATATGKLNASLKGAYFKTKDPDESGLRELDGFDVDGAGLGGFGIGIDLGATYKMDEFVEGLTLSAALLDLGFISWKNNLTASNDGSRSFRFDGFDNIAINDDGPNKELGDQFEDIGDDLEDMVKFYDNGNKGRRATGLATTLNIAGEYIFPYYKNLKFGLLSSTHINKPFTWTEARLSANVMPVSWFDASLNYACSTFGSSLGWVLNFHPKGFNFFIGTDHMLTKVNSWYIPVNHANANVSLGFNVTFGALKK